MDIISGKIHSAQKVVIYGPEGIGKSTFAAQFPSPLFIDTEGSTNNMNVRRLKKPTSWEMLFEQIEFAIGHHSLLKTLVIDTIDWAEMLCIKSVCSKHQKNGIEDFGYGNGYVYVKEELGRLLNRLDDVIDAGINVVLTAHAQIRKFEQPDEMGAYDRYELKLGKKTSSQTAPLVKEWADAVLFANYKTIAVAVDDKGKKNKAQGGRRVMYTAHHPCWDAKNRWGLPEETEFSYSVIASHIPSGKADGDSSIPYVSNGSGDITAITDRDFEPPRISEYDCELPKALSDLIDNAGVTQADVRRAVSYKGYYPEEMPISSYDPGFIEGVLIAAWPQVLGIIREINEKAII